MTDFPLDYQERELRALANQIRSPLDVFVIGGGAMSHYGIKPATKDLDVVVQTLAEARELARGLGALKYHPPGSLEDPYLKMEARNVLENKDGFRWDLFVRRVMGFEVGAEMRKRAAPWMAGGHLRVAAASREDVFVLKGVTERPRDRDDMLLLFEQGLNFNVVRDTILLQAQRAPGGPGVSEFNAGLEELIERTGIIYPGADEFADLAEREVGTRALLQVLGKEARTVKELAHKLEATQREVRAWVKSLQGAGLVGMEGSTVRRTKP